MYPLLMYNVDKLFVHRNQLGYISDKPFTCKVAQRVKVSFLCSNNMKQFVAYVF